MSGILFDFDVIELLKQKFSKVSVSRQNIREAILREILLKHERRRKIRIFLFYEVM